MPPSSGSGTRQATPAREARALGRDRGRHRPAPQSRHPAAAACAPGAGAAGPGRPPSSYGPEVAAAAAVLWQASGRIGAHRLQPFVPELLDRLTPVRRSDPGRPPSTSSLRQVSRPDPRAAAGARPGAVPAARRHHHAARHLAQARDPHPHLHRLGRRPARLLRDRSRRSLWDAAPRAFTSVRSARSTSPRRGSSSKPSGARASSESAGRASGARALARAPDGPRQLTMARVHQPPPLRLVSARTASPSPAAGPGRRMTAPTSSRRTAPSCATSSAMIASPPGRLCPTRPRL